MDQTSKKRTAKPYSPEFRERAVRLAMEHRDEYQTSRIQQMIGLAFLAPDIVDRIAAGSQPTAFTSEWFKTRQLPTDWEDQRGFIAAL